MVHRHAGNLYQPRAYLVYYQLDVFFKEPTFLIMTHYVLAYSSALCFMVVIPSFIMSVTLVPGYLEKKYDFIELVTELMDNQVDIDLLCTYCEAIKSQTSFHCLLC